MAYLTRYGSLWGMVPQNIGNVYWVSPAATYVIEGRTYSASDDNDGLSPERALRTVRYAVNTLAVADDTVVLLPGDHTVSTASLAMDAAGQRLMGLPLGGNMVRPRTTITTDIAADEIINVTAANCEIAYLRIIPITAATAVDASAAADNLYVHHCSFDMATPAVNVATIGLDFIGAASNALIEHNYVECDGAQGPWLDLGGALDAVVRDNVVAVSAGTWAMAVDVGTGASRVLCTRNQFQTAGAGVITAAVSGTNASVSSAVLFSYNFFGAGTTVAIDNFGAAEAEIVENYRGSIGGGSGGVLITAIT